MSEITKLYENAGIKSKAECRSKVCIVINPHKDWCNKCESLKHEYPPFTAEKQLELIKWLMNKSFSYSTVEDKDGIKYWFEIDYETSSHGYKNFEETIADTINEMWQTLTGREKEQIKEILE